MPSSSGGFEQAYNAQSGVDVETHPIVAQQVIQHTNDKQVIEPAVVTIGHLSETLGETQNIPTDTGYFSEANVQMRANACLVPFIFIHKWELQLKTIDTLQRNKKGKLSDKWASYLPVYDRIFSPYKDTPMKLLEIGVQNGGSLEVWSGYFSSAKLIVGCDINPLCRNLVYDDERISVVVSDVNSRNAFSEITAHSNAYDIIIDDGSHLSDDIIRTFIIYFQILSPGGIYVVEDTHTMYWDDYQGGILKQTTANSLFKLFVDLVNYEHWKEDLSIQNLFATFFPRKGTPPFLTEGWIEGIEFYNSMVVVRKSTQPTHAKLGERLTVGSEATVEPGMLKLGNA